MLWQTRVATAMLLRFKLCDAPTRIKLHVSVDYPCDPMTISDAVIEHWTKCLEGASAPSWEQFSSPLPYAQLGWINFVDLHSADRMIIRSMGSDVASMWGSDLTDTEIVSTYGKQIADQLYSDYFELLPIPCGLFERKESVQTSGLTVTFERYALPLQMQNVEFGRIIVAHEFLQNESFEMGPDDNILISHTSDRRWIDLGYGVPEREPTKQVSRGRSLQLTRDGATNVKIRDTNKF